MKELKQLLGHPNYYATEDGEIVRKKKNGEFKTLKKCKNNAGYEYVSLNTRNGYYFVAQLVYEAFNGEIPMGMEIDHVNGKKDDNRISNLRVLTHAQNLLNRRPSTRPSYYRRKGKYILKVCILNNPITKTFETYDEMYDAWKVITDVKTKLYKKILKNTKDEEEVYDCGIY